MSWGEEPLPSRSASAPADGSPNGIICVCSGTLYLCVDNIEQVYVLDQHLSINPARLKMDTSQIGIQRSVRGTLPHPPLPLNKYNARFEFVLLSID